MNLKTRRLLGNQVYFILITGGAALGTYTSMYAYRKGFVAATFTGLSFAYVDYKIWLIMAQVLGYTLSKFYGIRFIAEVQPTQRGHLIRKLILISWLALLGFALTPAPWNILFLAVNGFPLGMIWGLVFSFLEGRRTTELLGAILATSLIFASGLVKSVGRLVLYMGASEFWMPFAVGGIFIIPLFLFVGIMENIPPPDEADIAVRSKRKPMSARDRRQLLRFLWPGLLCSVLLYMSLTVLRDLRDNFEVEIWAWLKITAPGVLIYNDSLIAVVILALIASLVFVKDNSKAFNLIHIMIIAGCGLILVASGLYQAALINGFTWMLLVGLGLFMGYIPYNAIFFERLISVFQIKGNVGFLMYFADSLGYLGTIAILLVKTFNHQQINWGPFFWQTAQYTALFGIVLGTGSVVYFNWLQKRKQHSLVVKPELI